MDVSATFNRWFYHRPLSYKQYRRRYVHPWYVNSLNGDFSQQVAAADTTSHNIDIQIPSVFIR